MTDEETDEVASCVTAFSFVALSLIAFLVFLLPTCDCLYFHLFFKYLSQS